MSDSLDRAWLHFQINVNVVMSIGVAWRGALDEQLRVEANANPRSWSF